MSRSTKSYFANVWQELKFGYGLFLLYSFSALWWLSFFHNYQEALKIMNDLSTNKALSCLPWLPLALSLFTSHNFCMTYLKRTRDVYFMVSIFLILFIAFATFMADDKEKVMRLITTDSQSLWVMGLWSFLFFSVVPAKWFVHGSEIMERKRRNPLDPDTMPLALRQDVYGY